MLDAQWFTTDIANQLEQGVWGPGFEAPVFNETVQVVNQRLVGERHLKLSLKVQGQVRDAIWFGRSEPLPSQVDMAYRISVNEYQGRQSVQMIVEAIADAA